MAPRPPLPPFTAETATQKVRMAENAWNSLDPDRAVTTQRRRSRLGIAYPTAVTQLPDFDFNSAAIAAIGWRSAIGS